MLLPLLIRVLVQLVPFLLVVEPHNAVIIILELVDLHIDRIEKIPALFRTRVLRVAEHLAVGVGLFEKISVDRLQLGFEILAFLEAGAVLFA